MTHDISRSAHDPSKHYASALFQQGRIPLDDDLNEADTITKEDARRTRIDVIGPVGSPNDGFRISIQGATLGIAPGIIYVGGIPVVLETAETYETQADWPSLEALPSLSAPALVYLEVWQQVVTAVEDTELLEPALGGPDTTARMRTMRHVHVRSTTTTDCEAAWDELVATFAPGTYDKSTAEVKSAATLSVSFDKTGTTTNPCSPGVKAGYLGAENQTIRVQVAAGGTQFIWGFDNASALYVIQKIESVAAGTKITIAPPKDEEHQPRVGQIVELLDASAKLPQAEHVAALVGPTATVVRSYEEEDADTGSFVIDATTTAAFVRVWNQGDKPSAPSAIAAGTPTPLGSTGVTVTFGGSGFSPGDHWIIAARPGTDHAIPRSLENPSPPNGVRRFYAPLALVGQNPAGEKTVHDCRPTFDPLTAKRGCCTFTVGSEKTGAGHFQKIQDAVNNLPPGGGEICVLAGEYEENVTVHCKTHVTIHGCGLRTIVRPKDPTLPVFTIDGERISLSKMALEAKNESSFSPAIKILKEGYSDKDGGWDQDYGGPTKNASLHDLEITIRGGPAILTEHVMGLTVERVDVTVESLVADMGQSPDNVGAWPAIYVEGEDLLLERNHIEFTNPDDVTHHARGGIQVGGGSKRVELRRNRIVRGNGIGITLGHIVAETANGTTTTTYPPGGKMGPYFANGCLNFEPSPGPAPVEGGESTVVEKASEPVEDVRLIDNEVRSMGQSGVSVARLFPLIDANGGTSNTGVIQTNRILVENNRVLDCMQMHIGTPPTGDPYFAVGGVVLADAADVTIRGNFIERNGSTHDDPSCGVFIGMGEKVTIENNRIVGNGPKNGRAWDQYRGGIVIAAAAVIPIAAKDGDPVPEFPGPPDPTAVRVHDNVVQSPFGPALDLTVHGSCDVQSNELSSDATAFNGPWMQINIETFAIVPSSGSGPATGVVSIRADDDAHTLTSGASTEEAASTRYVASYTATGARAVFNDNAVSYSGSNGPNELPRTLVVVMGADDVSFQNNEVFSSTPAQITCPVLVGSSRTVRFNGNRISELVGVVSGLSYAPINVTTNNQTDHCLAAIGSKRVFVNNIALKCNDDHGAKPSERWERVGPPPIHYLAGGDVVS